MKKVTVTLDEQSISNAIKECQNFKKWLQVKVPEFLTRISELGLEIAKVRFEQAQYDGTNDVKCSIEKRGNGNNCVAIVATGTATLFIEFGTGVTYPDNYPEKHSEIAGRGEYGQGKGKNRTWGYYGDAGTHGKTVQNRKGQSVVITHGNPANMSMYFTVSDLQQEFERIAREVFRYG